MDAMQRAEENHGEKDAHLRMTYWNKFLIVCVFIEFRFLMENALTRIYIVKKLQVLSNCLLIF